MALHKLAHSQPRAHRPPSLLFDHYRYRLDNVRVNLNVDVERSNLTQTALGEIDLTATHITPCGYNRVLDLACADRPKQLALVASIGADGNGCDGCEFIGPNLRY